MKTPMQEMIEFMKEKLKEDTLHYNTHPSNGGLIAIRMSQFYLEIAESMLEKEKEVIMDAYWEGGHMGFQYQVLNVRNTTTKPLKPKRNDKQ